MLNQFFDLQNHTISAPIETSFDYAPHLSETSGLDRINMPPTGLILSVNPIGRPPISRRHSSSMFTTMTKPVTTHVTSYSDVNTNRYFNNIVGGALEILVEERFRNRAYSEGSSILSGDSGTESPQMQPQSVTSRYKTELCRPFEESGKCKYGDKCQFAHGKHELRHMVRHPKYKTELCRTYHSSGLCPYGPRCHFIHNQDEPTAAMQQMQPAGPTGPVNQGQRRNSSRPINLQLASQPRANNGFSYSPPMKSPLDTSSLVFGANDATVITPLSPLDNNNSQLFNFTPAPLSPVRAATAMTFEGRQGSPPLSGFHYSQNQFSDLSVQDDGVFLGSQSSSDSERESITGSPPGFGVAAPCQQRLPIFRCLSQSDQKGV